MQTQLGILIFPHSTRIWASLVHLQEGMATMMNDRDCSGFLPAYTQNWHLRNSRPLLTAKSAPSNEDPTTCRFRRTEYSGKVLVVAYGGRSLCYRDRLIILGEEGRMVIRMELKSSTENGPCRGKRRSTTAWQTSRISKPSSTTPRR